MVTTSHKRLLQLAAFILLVMVFGSCGTVKKSRKELLYLQGKLDTVPNLDVLVKEPKIEKGDRLSITVYSDNPAATALFNQPQISGTAAGTTSGYLVDQRGDIRFQTLGIVHVEGLTKLELMKQMDEKLKTYLTNPYTDIRFLNFRVSIIGEVNKPGPVTIPEEKLSILELVGLAGDLTVYGRRDNVLVIREQQGKREFGRIDLRDPNIFQSPYFYLQQNDIVLVEASKKKPTADDQRLFRNLTLATSITGLISTGVFLYTIFVDRNN
jgi:polysaccharide export outer membrane protein